MRGEKRGSEGARQKKGKWREEVKRKEKRIYLKVSPKIHSLVRAHGQFVLVFISECQLNLVYQLVHIGQSQPLALLLWPPRFLCCIYSWFRCVVLSPLTASSWSSKVVALAAHIRRQHRQNSHPSNPFLILKYWYPLLSSAVPPGCWVMGDWGQSTSLILIKCPVYWTRLTGCDR